MDEYDSNSENSLGIYQTIKNMFIDSIIILPFFWFIYIFYFFIVFRTMLA